MESPVDSNAIKGSLDDIMDDEDWALIFDTSGRLKAIFIPEGKQEDEVPQALLHVMSLFNLDVNDAEDATIH